MALQNLDISETLISLGNFLQNDSAIQDFCMDHFGEPIKVYVGDFVRKTIPTSADCPYIVLTDFKKKEGQPSFLFYCNALSKVARFINIISFK